MATRWLQRGLALVLASGACDADEDAPEPGTVERLVADRSANAVVHQTNLVLITQLFAADASLGGATVDEARAGAVASLVARLGAIDFQDCTPQVTSDPVAGVVTASFSGCQVGPFVVEGDTEAHVEIETVACGTETCASAVVWTLPDFDVIVGPDRDSRPRFNGEVVLRDPVPVDGGPDLPMSWTTQPGFTLGNRLGTFEVISHASWTVDDQRCVEMQLEARLDRIDPEDADKRIRTIVVSVDGLRRCPARCPERGRVRIAFGRGALLEWSYDGIDEVEVELPRGRRFVQGLVCRA